ncbi:hypothetical protein C7E23_18070, partial [Elizabethkingia anophelis]
MDVADPDAGTIDATVEISAGCLRDGPQVIILDADVDEAPERYLVLNEPWQSLSAGTLLLVSGNTAAIISTQEANKEATQAERMLTFLDYLPFDAGRNALVEPGIEAWMWPILMQVRSMQLSRSPPDACGMVHRSSSWTR